MKKAIKSQLSKVKFALGLNPMVRKDEMAANYIPSAYKAVLTITADFELAWAPRYTNAVSDSYQHAIQLARQERSNIPNILANCEAYNIPITWATVGHLFLHSCQVTAGGIHPEIPAVPPYQGPYWDFTGNNWFEFDPCSNVSQAPEWYGPDLIDLIIHSGVNHEIGCHTFSHIDCRDEVCPPELFESELRMCQKLAGEKSISLRSFVHPGHTIGNLNTLANLGFTSFQTDPGNILGVPVRHSNQLWELRRTMVFDYRPQWSIKYHIYRYKKIVDRTIENGLVCNFWFHPSVSPVFIDEIFPELCSYIDSRKNELWVTTVNDYVEFLNSKEWKKQL